MIVIHIGLAKAGSTTIQWFLKDNEDALRAYLVDYAIVGRGRHPNHRNLSSEILDAPEYEHDRGGLRSLADYWRDALADTMIISAEQLEACDTNQALRFSELRRNDSEEIRIVMIIRDLISQTPSSYAQMVKTGQRVHSFDNFFKKRMQSSRVDQAWTAQQWANAFGWASLRVRLLAPDQLVNNDLIDDFLCQLDIDVDEMWAQSLYRRGSMNVTPGWRVVEAIRALYSGRADLPDHHPLAEASDYSDAQRRAIGHLAIEIGGEIGWNADRGRYLTLEQAEWCNESFAASIRKLNNFISVKLPLPPTLDEQGFVPRREAPDASHIPGAELRDFYDSLAIRWANSGTSRRRRR